ncbi:hypothetical protein KY5_2344 [Streptomyces formicae]|uniref:Uncharacterized protein n=1 Tax=Streptomyces formicae TaxID=1616117 RepID=A0A291Q6Y3_9ACTN|nr:hypothetical protein KY5_2344 [Streptomyces formicae]
MSCWASAARRAPTTLAAWSLSSRRRCLRGLPWRVRQALRMTRSQARTDTCGMSSGGVSAVRRYARPQRVAVLNRTATGPYRLSTVCFETAAAGRVASGSPHPPNAVKPGETSQTAVMIAKTVITGARPVITEPGCSEIPVHTEGTSVSFRPVQLAASHTPLARCVNGSSGSPSFSDSVPPGKPAAPRTSSTTRRSSRTRPGVRARKASHHRTRHSGMFAVGSGRSGRTRGSTRRASLNRRSERR